MESRNPIYIVDDCANIRATLAAAVAIDYPSVRQFATAEEVLAEAETLPPGIILLDLQLPGRDGIALQDALIEAGERFAIIFLTGIGQIPDAVRALRKGAVDFLQKPYRRLMLREALRAAEARLETLRETADRRQRLQVLDRLTSREREVLRQLATGKPSKVIAHSLGLSTRTVEMHRGNISQKLRMPITSALLLAQEAGLVSTITASSP